MRLMVVKEVFVNDLPLCFDGKTFGISYCSAKGGICCSFCVFKDYVSILPRGYIDIDVATIRKPGRPAHIIPSWQTIEVIP